MIQAQHRLEVLLLAGAPTQQRVGAALSLVARRVTAVSDGPALIVQIWEQAPQVIIIEGPGQPASVPALCRQIRQFFQTPILIVGEGASEEEHIAWLDSGADDVLALPEVAPAELGARCYALLRRLDRQRQRHPEALCLQALGMQLDVTGRRLLAPARNLSARHTRLLALFFSYGDVVIPPAVLEAHMFGVSGLSVRRRTSLLIQGFNRRMAEVPGARPHIERVRRFGYRLAVRP